MLNGSTAADARAPGAVLLGRSLLLIALFLIFTPFETDGSLGATYVMTFATMLLLVLVVPRSGLDAFVRPGIALIFPAAMIVHSILIAPEVSGYPILLIMSIVATILLVAIANDMSEDFLFVARLLLVINMIGLLIQLSAFQASGEVLDIHKMIFPMSAARIETEAGGVIRLTGLQLEPGNYSNWMALLIITLRLVAGRFTLIEYLAAASIALTFSATGIAFLALLLAWMAADVMAERSRTKWVLALAFFAAVVAIASSYDLLDYYEARFLGREDGSVLYRYMSLDAYSYLTWIQRVIGFGFADEICDGCHFNDLGFGPNLAMRGGILMVACAIPWAWRSLHRQPLIAIVVATGTAFLAKTPQYSMAAWFVLLLVSGVHALQEEPARAGTRTRTRSRPLGTIAK